MKFVEFVVNVACKSVVLLQSHSFAVILNHVVIISIPRIEERMFVNGIGNRLYGNRWSGHLDVLVRKLFLDDFAQFLVGICFLDLMAVDTFVFGMALDFFVIFVICVCVPFSKFHLICLSSSWFTTNHALNASCVNKHPSIMIHFHPPWIFNPHQIW